jgi:hypothetical protein
MMYTAETKYNENKEAIMTSLYKVGWDYKIFLIAVAGWKNLDDMLKFYRTKI